MSFSSKYPVLYDRLENQIAVLHLAKGVKVTQRQKQEWTVEFDCLVDPDGKWELISTECLVEVNGQKYVLKIIDNDDSSGEPMLHCQGEHVSSQAIDWFIDPSDDTRLNRTSLMNGVTAQTALTNALAGSRFTLGTVEITGFATTLATDAAQGATTISVVDASGISVNTLIQIGSGQATVTAKNGTTLTISPGLYAKQLQGTPVGFNIHDINMQERNLTDVIREIEQTWGGELSFSNRTISFVQQIGQSNGVQFRYRKNNKQIKRTEDSKSLATRLYGYGAGGVTIESIYPTKYIDAATISNYPAPIAVSKNYPNISDPETLYQAMKSDLADLSTPKVTYDMTVVELAKVSGYNASLETFGLGDYISVIDERLNNVSIVTRIFEYEYYPYEPQLSHVQLQSFIETTYDQMKKVHSGVTSLIQTVNISPRRNNRPIIPVSAPNGQSIVYTQNTDGSVNLVVGWSYTEDSTSPIDGFGVVVHSDVSNVTYLFPTTINADTNGTTDKTVRGFELHGVPANKYYTVAVYPYRLVDADIDSDGIIKGDLWYVNNGTPYRPSSTVVFTGNIQDKFGNIAVDQNGLNLLNIGGWGVQSGLLLSYSNYNPPTAANNYAGMTISSLTASVTVSGSSPYTGPTTVSVGSTAGFPSSGTAYLGYPGTIPIAFDYTGLTATSFTGVSNWRSPSGWYNCFVGTYNVGSKVFLWLRPTASINVSSGLAVNQNNSAWNISSYAWNSEDVGTNAGDFDGWEFRYVWIDPNGNLQIANAGTSGGLNNYPPSPPSGSIRLGWFVVGCGKTQPNGQLGTGPQYDGNGIPVWSINVRMDVAYRDVRPISSNATTNTVQSNMLDIGTQQNSITVNPGQTTILYIPIGNNVKKSCQINITPNSTVNGADSSRSGAAMTVSPQPNGSQAGNRPIWGTYVDPNGVATNIDQQQNNATYGNYMIPPSVLGCSYTVIQDIDIVPDPSTPSQTDLKIVFYNYSGTAETLNLRFNWHSF